jgi:hypothetical protein
MDSAAVSSFNVRPPELASCGRIFEVDAGPAGGVLRCRLEHNRGLRGSQSADNSIDHNLVVSVEKNLHARVDRKSRDTQIAGD